MLETQTKTSIKVVDTQDLDEIREALEAILFVPDSRLRYRVIEELISYFKKKFNNELFKFKAFISYSGKDVSGFVTSMVDPQYTSYSRKCGSFGWLNAYDFDTCEALILACEKFIRANRIRKIRGDINYPKKIGGLGIQNSGFERQMLYGVAFNDPNSRKLEYLDRLGYFTESEYACMEVTQKIWSSGKNVDKDIRIGHITLDELIKRKDELLGIAQGSLYSILPDATGGEARLQEVFNTFKEVPNTFYKLEDGFNPRDYTDIPEIIEAWESYDLENVLTWVHLAFERKTDDIVGIIICIPDLYELWLGKPITRCNVDTAMVKAGYTGKGIFSSLNNLGRATLELNGIKYFEGTAIWYNNKEAVKSIFPHSIHARRHYVVQKRV
jgi:hypothetical protein